MCIPTPCVSNNDNLRLIMVKTNRSTLHTVYNIQQSATQGSNDTTNRLSRRTAATTRFRPEGRLPETDGAKVLPTFDQVASIQQMALPEHTSDKQACFHFDAAPPRGGGDIMFSGRPSVRPLSVR